MGPPRRVSPSPTLAGVPSEAFAYRLGNRSALERVIDQYQVTEDKRSGVRSDPNRADDPEYIVKLVGRVVRVSVETVRVVAVPFPPAATLTRRPERPCAARGTPPSRPD